MSDEHTEAPELRNVPTYLNLTLHRAYFFAGLFGGAVGLAALFVVGNKWACLLTLMWAAMLLVSSYTKRIEIRSILVIGLIALIGGFAYELYVETPAGFGWTDLRRPAYGTALFVAVSMLMWWGEKRRRQR